MILGSCLRAVFFSYVWWAYRRGRNACYVLFPLSFLPSFPLFSLFVRRNGGEQLCYVKQTQKTLNPKQAPLTLYPPLFFGFWSLLTTSCLNVINISRALAKSFEKSKATQITPNHSKPASPQHAKNSQIHLPKTKQ